MDYISEYNWFLLNKCTDKVPEFIIQDFTKKPNRRIYDAAFWDIAMLPLMAFEFLIQANAPDVINRSQTDIQYIQADPIEWFLTYILDDQNSALAFAEILDTKDDVVRLRVMRKLVWYFEPEP